MRDAWLHPNGVLPEGNILFAGCSNREGSVRMEGLGRLQKLPDSLIADILALCDGQSLARCSSASKVLYVFCQLDYLWRDLVLLHTRGEGIRFHKTWKETYKLLKTPSNPDHCSATPQIRLKNFYSQFLFHSWLCAHYEFDDVAPGFLRHEDIPRVSAKDLSVEEFIEKYEIPNRPVIIVDALSEQWSALTAWTAEYLIAQGGEKKFRARSTAAVMPALFTMKDYLQYASQVQEESPLYLFERRFADVGQLGSDYRIPDYFNPEEFERLGLTAAKGYDTDLFRLLGERRRPDHRWLVVGPRKSGSIFHIDPNQTNAWNVSVQGRKKWIFYPPDVQPPGVQSSPDGGDVIVPVSLAEWLINFWSFHQEARCHKDPSKRPLEAVLKPGEIMFVPHNYWHMVVNLDFSVALTHNYVSTSNLFSCLKFLRFKSDQISGVRDHQDGEEICADNFYSSFTERLSEHFPASHPIYSHCMTRIEKLEKANKSKDSSVGSVVARCSVFGGKGRKSLEGGEVEEGEGVVSDSSRKRKGEFVSAFSDRETARPRHSSSDEDSPSLEESLSTPTFRFDFLL